MEVVRPKRDANSLPIDYALGEDEAPPVRFTMLLDKVADVGAIIRQAFHRVDAAHVHRRRARATLLNIAAMCVLWAEDLDDET
jgi:hypothetical protein